MHATPPVLAPGQRFRQSAGAAPQADEQVTIARLDQDSLGFPRVTFRFPNGRELTAYAAQVEAAIAEGDLAPIVGR